VVQLAYENQKGVTSVLWVLIGHC